MSWSLRMERLKSGIIGAWDRAIKLGKWLVSTYLTKKPFLMRVEYHIVDHCNLNCKGCSHFSNLSPERFRNVLDFEKDISSLTSKVALHELVLLGANHYCTRT